MANPLFAMFSGVGGQPAPVFSGSGGAGGPQFQNPMQKMQYIMQAMSNPAAFVRQHFPDIPEGIQNDPRQILGYLQQTRGISNQQVQQAQQMAQQMAGGGMMR